MKFLTRNWSLKLLALILAIVIYHSLKTQGYSLQRTHDRVQTPQQP